MVHSPKSLQNTELQVPGEHSMSTRPTAVTGFVALILTLQALLAADTFRDRFLNPAVYHYFYDNAFFTAAARRANMIGWPTNRCGVVVHGPRAAWGEPTAPPQFYSHHPYGMKVLMQHAMLFSGYSEAASRGFSLAVAMCAALGMLATLSLLSGSMMSGAIGAAAFVSLPVMAIYQTCVKFEIDGMAAAAWVFPAIVSFLKHEDGPRRLMLVVIGVGCALSSWTGMMFGGLVAAALFADGSFGSRRKVRRTYRAAGLWLAAGIAAGLLLLLGLFVWQKGGVEEFTADLGGAFRVHSERVGFTNAEWVIRQRDYLSANFGYAGLVMLGCGLLLVVRGFLRPESLQIDSPSQGGHPRLLFLLLGASLATTLLWVVVFREGSYVHEYWSMVGCMPIAVTATMLVAASPARYRLLASCAGVMFVLAMYLTAWRALASRLEAMRSEGNGPDVEFVGSFQHDRFDRFVFVPLADHPFNVWFDPRLFEYYTDRTVVPVTSAGEVGSGDKVIVLAYTEQTAAEQFVEKQLGIRLANRRCGPRFCVYDAIPAEATAGGATPDPD